MNVNFLPTASVRNESSAAGNGGTRITTEDELIAKLKQMHTDYRRKELEERKESAAESLPEEPDYEYKEYTGASEDEIRQSVEGDYGSKFESEKNVLESETKSKTDELANKAEDAYYDYGKTEAEILASLESNKKKNRKPVVEEPEESDDYEDDDYDDYEDDEDDDDYEDDDDDYDYDYEDDDYDDEEEEVTTRKKKGNTSSDDDYDINFIDL